MPGVSAPHVSRWGRAARHEMQPHRGGEDVWSWNREIAVRTFFYRKYKPLLLQFHRHVDVSRTAGKVLSPNKGSLHSHSCISKTVWHWAPLVIEAQPTCSTSSKLPTCRWTLHLSPAGLYQTLPPPTPPLFTGLFQKKGKADFSMFNKQGMVVTLHRARKGNVLVCESAEKEKEIHRFLAVPQSLPANTDRNLPFRGAQTGTFLGAAAGCLNSVSFSYGVLFANGDGFNAIDMSTGKQLYLPWRDYQRHKPELDDLVSAFIQNRYMTQFIIRST